MARDASVAGGVALAMEIARALRALQQAGARVAARDAVAGTGPSALAAELRTEGARLRAALTQILLTAARPPSPDID